MHGADENRRILKEAADQGKFSDFSVDLLKKGNFDDANFMMPWYPTALFAELVKKNYEGVKILLDAGARIPWGYFDTDTGISYTIHRINKIESCGYDADLEDNADDESAPLAEMLEFNLKIIATTEANDEEVNVEEGAGGSEGHDNFQALDADKMEEENDSMLQLEEQQTDENYDNNPFLEKAINAVILFEEIDRDAAMKPKKEEDEIPDPDTFYKSAEYKDDTSIIDGLPEIDSPHLIGLLPEVNSIFA